MSGPKTVGSDGQVEVTQPTLVVDQIDPVPGPGRISRVDQSVTVGGEETRELPNVFQPSLHP